LLWKLRACLPWHCTESNKILICYTHTMNPEIEAFLTKERIGVLSVLLADGSPHAATIHFSHIENPLKLYVQTRNTTTKAKPFLNGEVGKAAFVVGFSEEEWI